ncbi:TPA: hypothetical protein ACGN8S_005180 [Bacillus cereus]
MSTIQSQYKNKRLKILNKIKQPGHLSQSMQFIKNMQVELKETVQNIQDLYSLDMENPAPALPEISLVLLNKHCNSDSYSELMKISTSDMKNMEQIEREAFLNNSLEVYEEIENLFRTIFILLFNSNKELLDNYLKENPKTESILHYDLENTNGFDLSTYESRIHSLQNDIRLEAFKKFLSLQSMPKNIDEAELFFNAEILPKINEIISLIDPCITKSDLMANAIIEFGTGIISKHELIERLKKILKLIHEISIMYYCSTLEEAIEEYLLLQYIHNN